MIKIQLSKGEWEYDPDSPLGSPGGFGAVFVGRGETYGPVAIKKLHLSASDTAHRELKIADALQQISLQYVIPIFDAGKDEDTESYFVVMPRAEKSLQQELNNIGTYSDIEAIKILQDIAFGLSEVPNIVHRDLKPGNILFHDGRWKIADFGIARFTEESTSLQTLKNCLSPPYAAPEQWKLERATSATDIYALGCIAYSLLSGSSPFPGPKLEDYKNQHLQAEPPSLKDKNPRLRMLLAIMLRKTPQSRPSLERVQHLLNKITEESSSELASDGFSALAEAGADEAEAISNAEADRMKSMERQRTRNNLADQAFLILRNIIETLFERICDAAPTAEVIQVHSHRQEIKFGKTNIFIENMSHSDPLPVDAFQNSGWDVIAGAIILIIQDTSQRYEWGANLWYTNMGKGDEYRWWEIPYMHNPLLAMHTSYQPFALNDLVLADQAASPVMGKVQFAATPRMIDDENIEDFCDRWAKLLAIAYKGQLRQPSQLPLPD